MLAYQHSGFSVDAGVCIQAHDRASKPSKARYLWAAQIASICEVFALLCPMCGGQMRIIALITHSAPARGPPLWDDCGDAQVGEGVEGEPDWDLAAQPAPDYEVDQRVNW